MTDEEKKQLVVAVITQLKNEGTDVSNADIVSNANGIDYVVAYGKNGQIVRAVPTAISSEKVGATGYMNAYTEAGVYNINTSGGEDLPITNQGAISARLTVLVTESGGNKVITQVLNLNNNTGGEGNVYIRSQQNGTWKAWGKLQSNIEVGQVNTLNHLTDNGIYSGVFTDGTPTSVGTFYDTFVLIVINNYAVSIPTGNPQSISQLKYSLGIDGSISVASRKRDQYGYWDNWASLDEKSLVAEEKTRAEQAEQDIKDKAVEADSLNFLTRANEVALDYKTIDGTGDEVTIPAANTESAGVMSAEDKRLIAACNSYLVNDASNLQDAINALSNIIPNENKNSGVIVNFVDENGSLRSFVFSSNVGGFTNPVRWIDIAGNQTYIVDDKPANYYRLSELIKNIKVQATGEFDVNATYSIGQFGYAPSFGSNIVEIKRDGERLGIIYFNNSLVGELDASNLKIIVSVKSFRETTGVYDYSQYNRINPQLFTDAYESWKLNATEAVANKNTTAIAVVADVIYESDIVAVDTMVQQGKYYNNLGGLVDDSARCCTMPFDVAAGERYYITCRIGGSTVIAYVAMWGADGEWLGVADGFIGGSGNAVDRVFIVPEGVEKVALSSYNTTAPTLKKLVHGDSTAFYTKNETYNRDEIDTLISNSPGGGGGSDVDSNFINNVETISFNVEDNAITEAVLLGTGWSGNLINGYSHTSGNTEPLEFDLPYASLEKFILEFKCDGVKGDSTDLLIAVGDTPTVKSYNGGSNFRIGFVANGGRLKINPANNFASTITDIAIRKISNSGNSTITINVGDVYSQANAMITAFWNIAIGSNNMTLSRLINGSRNVAIGRNTLNTATSGNRNIAIGTFAMPFLTEAEENVAIGADTIYPLTKAIGCVGIGKATLSGTQKAEYCVAIGKSAMGTYGISKDRTKCTAIGVSAGPSITDSCTHVGYRAGANVAGAKNTSIGYGSMAVGERSTIDIIGEELTCIGYYSQIDNTDEAKAAKNSTAIGANTKITKSNQVVIGNANVEEVVIAGKKIIFYADGIVKWENI